MTRIDEWNTESFIAELGYAADGSVTELRRHIILDRVLGMNDEGRAFGVIRHLRWLIDDRGDRFPRANRVWQSDLEYICRGINARSDAEA